MASVADSIAAGDVRWGTLSPWWRRAIAELIDFGIVGLAANCLLLVVGEQPWWYGHIRDISTGAVMARYVTGAVVALGYYPLVVWYTNGQTLGKKALKIRVIRTSGEKMSVALATWREVVLKFVLLEFVGLLPAVGLTVSELLFWADGLWPLWDRENRALHDMLARTRVVRI